MTFDRCRSCAFRYFGERGVTYGCSRGGTHRETCPEYELRRLLPYEEIIATIYRMAAYGDARGVADICEDFFRSGGIEPREEMLDRQELESLIKVITGHKGARE